MSTTEQLAPEGHPRPDDIRVTVRYLPAAHPFQQTYAPATVVETVRTEAMTFFGVSDHEEGRSVYRYYLELDGVRITNTSQTLAQLAAEHHHTEEIHFHLIEEITQG